MKQSNPLFYQFENLSQFADTQHFVSTRNGGYSENHLSSLNISLNVNDLPENVIRNRQALAEAVGFDEQSYVFANQVHSKSVALITEQERGRGLLDYNDSIMTADAMITNCKNICLMALGADCVPMLFYDAENQVIGSAHAGWRGTVQKIAVEVVKAMEKEFQSQTENIWVGIGPCISRTIYEVGEEVVNVVKIAFGTEDKYLIFNEKTQKFHFDLVYANRQQLIDTGVKADHIEDSGFCTYQNSDIFFSSRYDQGKTGRFGSGIILI